MSLHHFTVTFQFHVYIYFQVILKRENFLGYCNVIVFNHSEISMMYLHKINIHY
jgi:hypothetical protein